MKNPPQHLRTLLWEYDIDTMDRDHPIVSERVLAFGDRWDIAYIWLERLTQFFITEKPMLDKKSHHFWEIMSWTKVDNPAPSLYEQINTPTSRRNFR